MMRRIRQQPRKHSEYIEEKSDLNGPANLRSKSATEALDWLAKNAMDCQKEVSALYGLCAEDGASRFTQPGSGFPKNLEYRWTENGEDKAISSPEYVNKVLTWVEQTLADPTVVPVDDTSAFPGNFFSTVSKIFTRLFRVYAIMYHHHIPVLERQEAVPYLEKSFQNFMHFAFENDLIRKREFRPLQNLVNELLHEFKAQPNLEVMLWESDNLHEDSSSPEGLQSSGSNQSMKTLSSFSESELQELKEESRFAFEESSTLLAGETPIQARHSRGSRNLSYTETLATWLNTAGLENILRNVLEKEENDLAAAQCVAHVREMIEAEMEFGDVLCKVMEEYMLPAKEVAMISETTLCHMFVDIHSILRFSEFLCSEMHLALQNLNLPCDTRSSRDVGLSPRRRASTSDCHCDAPPPTSKRHGKPRRRTSIQTTGSVTRHIPTCPELVRAFLGEAILPNMALLSQVFGGFLMQYSDSVVLIHETMSKNYRFSRLVQSKNAKLNITLIDLLKAIYNRPKAYLEKTMVICDAFHEYLFREESKPLEGQLSTKGRFSSPMPKIPFRTKAGAKEQDPFIMESIRTVQLHVSAVHTRAQFHKYEKSVQKLRSDQQLRQSSPADFRYGSIFRDRWQSCMVHVFEKDVLLTQCTPDCEDGSGSSGLSLLGKGGENGFGLGVALRKISKKIGHRRSNSDSSVSSAASANTRPIHEDGPTVKVTNKRHQEVPSRLLPSKVFGLPVQNELESSEKFQVEGLFSDIEVSPRQAKAARIESRPEESMIWFYISFSGRDKSGVKRSLQLRIADFDTVVAIFRLAGLEVPLHLNSFPNYMHFGLSSTIERWASSRSLSASKITKVSCADAGLACEQADFFICHHPPSSSLAAMEVYLDLKDRAYRPWVEQMALHPGHVFKALKSAKVVLFLVSPGALSQPAIRAQLTNAWQLCKPIYILQVDSHPLDWTLERMHCPPLLTTLLDHPVQTVPIHPERRLAFWEHFLLLPDLPRSSCLNIAPVPWMPLLHKQKKTHRKFPGSSWRTNKS